MKIEQNQRAYAAPAPENRSITDGRTQSTQTIRSEDHASAAGRLPMDRFVKTAGDIRNMTDALNVLNLEQWLPGSRISVQDLSGKDQLILYARNHPGQFQLVLSPEVLQKMQNDTEFRDWCLDELSKTWKSLLNQAERYTSSGRKVTGTGIYVGADGKICQWIASQEPGNVQNLPGPSTKALFQGNSISRYHNRDGSTITLKKKPSYTPSRDLSRLARARNQQMVKVTISSIRRSIYQLKSGSYDAKEAMPLTNQAEQVLRKALLKSKQLKREELIDSARKRAERSRNLKKAMYLKRLLKEKQVKRTVREYGQIHDYYPSPQELKAEEERLKDQLKNAVGGISQTGRDMASPSSPAASPGNPSAAAMPSGGTAVTIDITI
ncbi:hypothetical protein KTH81_04240 [Lachnospiraceae bacterium ASD3451]|uniref:DUF6033 family protein n=1 Tax=Diplocloster agilis TaxID=2850323 RepID=UPI001D656A74|nr:DUF6033 family protein [Diplocloster agilis]MBU9743023.1 hypothetical protein [Diplocloster agilis]